MTRKLPRLALPTSVLAGPHDLPARFEQIRAELGVPAEFGPEVIAEAEHAVPEPSEADLSDLEFITLDPPGATDLDQAMHLARRDGAAGGYQVDYAIADVPAFVAAGGAIAAEAMRRGETIYAPDKRTPLHPPVLSEGAASLLPGALRPAFVWRFLLDSGGSVESLELVRASVRSRQQLDYPSLQAALDAGDSGQLGLLAGLLKEIGQARQALELARGGASLPLPAQEATPDASPAGFALELRAARPIEDWNAQLSLMTGMAAAELMLKAGFGVLRTLPRPDDGAMHRFAGQARALGIDWPDGESYGAFLRRLDGSKPRELALLHAAGALFRGAAYVPFDGSPPAQTGHAAVAAPYAHVTAPLRRLVDRFGLVAAHAAFQGRPLPDWARAGFGSLPAAMTASNRRAGQVEHRCLDAVEVALLTGREGEVFPAVVVDADQDGSGGHIQLLEPPVLARCAGALSAGSSISVTLQPIEPGAGEVRFALA